MNKKLFFVLVCTLLFMVGCGDKTNETPKEKETKNEKEPTVETVSLMKFDNFKTIDKDNIKSITFAKLTEDGRYEKEMEDAKEIQDIYNYLSSIKVGEQSNGGCEDNTRIYTFNMSDGTNISVEIECDWLVIGNNRYNIYQEN